MISNPHTWAVAWGGTKPATNHALPRLEGEAFIRALEIVSAYLQGRDTTVARMLRETHAEDCCEITYRLIDLAYAIDSALQEEHTTQVPCNATGDMPWHDKS
jgi:hypothetical protein